jgi:hypothetical protein
MRALCPGSRGAKNQKNKQSDRDSHDFFHISSFEPSN